MQRENSNIDLPLGPSGPKKSRKGVIIAGAVGVLLLGLFIGQASGSKGDTAKAAAPAPTSTTPAPSVAYPYPTVDPTLGDETDAPAADPQPVADVNPEAKACYWIHKALSMPAYSSRWDTYEYKAEDAAKSDAMYRAIYKAGNEIWGSGYNYEAEATADLKAAQTKFC